MQILVDLAAQFDRKVAFLGRGMHYLEAFDEAVADGAWGSWAARRIGEPLRQGLDL